MFALRWNDKQGNSLRIDSSIRDGVEVETKTEGSDSFVWVPASIETELEFWRGAAAWRKDERAHQMLRRTCSTYMAQITSVKDVKAHLRHMNARTTLEH